MTLEELKAVNRYAESTRSLSYLPQVNAKVIVLQELRQLMSLGTLGSHAHCYKKILGCFEIV